MKKEKKKEKLVNKAEVINETENDL